VGEPWVPPRFYMDLTSTEHNASMGRRLQLLLVALGALLALGAVPSGLAAQRTLVSSLFGAKLVRADVVVLEGGAARALRVDRGRVTAVGGGTLRLLERDGTAVTVAVASDAAITTRGRPGRLADLRRGQNVTVVREGDAAASFVVQPALAVTAELADLLFGPKMMRAEVLFLDGVLHDYRVDRGRITGARVGLLRLRERDGTVLTLPVASDADVRLHGRPVRLGAVRGRNASVLREGDGPVTAIHAGAGA
jgi:hypothetical protein